MRVVLNIDIHIIWETQKQFKL